MSLINFIWINRDNHFPPFKGGFIFLLNFCHITSAANEAINNAIIV